MCRRKTFLVSVPELWAVKRGEQQVREFVAFNNRIRLKLVRPDGHLLGNWVIKPSCQEVKS
jgi:hypothetical protein